VKNISILKITLSILFLMMVGSLSISAQTTDCSKTTDAEIAKSVMEQIKAKYPDLTQQVNAHVENGVVYLEGWVADKNARKEIEKIAKRTSCVKKVKSNLKKSIGGGCGAGQKPCGDACIPSNHTCNISKGS
jgi:hypothetical protein